MFLLLTVVAGGRSNRLEAAEVKYVIQWQIDRSAVPNLPVDDITLNVAVGAAEGISAVDSSGADLPFIYNPQTGVASITTAGDSIELTFFTETTGNPLIGSYVPATLKFDRKWAWSHGIDDNENLEGSIEQFQKRGWTGTLFLIGEYVERARTEPNLISASRVQSLLAEGWSIGNHTYNYDDCDPRPSEYVQNILDGQVVLNEIIATSEVPDYLPLSLAAPCFLNGFQPALQSLKTAGTTDLRINESGANIPLVLDPGAIELFLEDSPVLPFSPDEPVGRDGTIDQGTLDEATRNIDWVARNASGTRHLWYNSLSHGEREDNVGVEARLGSLVEYVYRKYGPLGTNEVWVAPSDHIVSYVTIRDLATFRVVSASRAGEPLSNDAIRQVEPNLAGNLESLEVLPTRIRPVDTPIPIVPVVIEAAQADAPTVAPLPSSAEVTPEAQPISPVVTAVPQNSADQGQPETIAGMAVLSVMIVAVIVGVILLAILGFIILRLIRRR